jgi:hypothetical protein
VLPRTLSAASVIRHLNRAGRLPARVTYGAAAAALLAVAGVSAGAALGPAPAFGAVADAGPAGPFGHPTAAAALSTAGRPASLDGASHTGAATPFGPATPLDAFAPGAHSATARPGGAQHGATTVHRTAPHAAAQQAAAGAQRQSTSHGTAAPHQPAAPAKPYQIYDSVTPSAIPAGRDVATYATGPFAVRSSQVAGRNVLWIDTRGSDPRASALDVEPGDATPHMAARWAQAKLSASRNATAIIYTMISEWRQTQAAISTLPSWMHSHIRWWIADPTGVRHMVPGANATQWYWGQNYDISTAQPGF